MRSTALVIGGVVACALGAGAYLHWEYHRTAAAIDARIAARKLPAPSLAQLVGVWESEAVRPTERRQCRLEFRPDGRGTWTTRVTVGELKPYVSTHPFTYSCDLPFNKLVLDPITNEPNAPDRKAARPSDIRPWLIRWVTEGTEFQIGDTLTDTRSHLRFRRMHAE